MAPSLPATAEPTAAGWGAIDAACERLYGDQPPRHVGYIPGRAFGSVLQGCSAYRADDHWHYVTYGLSNLFDENEGENDGLSGWGYELTWRVRDLASEAQAPGWPFTVLQRLAKWASDSGVLLEEGSRLTIGSPVTGYPHTDGPDTHLTGILLASDPELGEIDTANGRLRFLQFVAVDAESLGLAQERGSARVLERLGQADPLMVTVVGG
ncbi:suppressor of fused domain protein [Actinotalea sp. JY-7885]|uniref:suppressor of fused domain protein n=1 Tax=Actinotalea sp. JY-7885 TaxID=2758576 RepID=UPI0021059D05|nr:suppressor of fused domain protein [Actinotalea sp. JY-7885]